jgi:quinol monooxygenase YgiN
MIYVIATLELAEGRRDDYLDEFKKLIPKVRAEAGCLEYGPALDVPTNIPVQEPVSKNTMTIIERWSDLPALKEHLVAPHMKIYREAVKTFVVGMKIRILQPLDV